MGLRNQPNKTWVSSTSISATVTRIMTTAPVVLVPTSLAHEQDACVGQEIKELNSPFGNFLKNLLCGGGRERKARVESGEIDVNDDPTVQVIYFKGVLATKPLKIDNFNLLNCNKIIFYSRKSKRDIGLFVDFCEFTCFYQFLHDVLIKLF